jgi:small subunit ribosomal protein S8
MSQTDPIADFLTRIRNALRASHETVECKNSKINKAVAGVLKDEGFIEDFMVLDDRKQGIIQIDLKYTEGKPTIEKIERASRPGRRSYAGVEELPKVLGGMGMAIVSTSKGIMTDKNARRERVGGEIICTVY